MNKDYIFCGVREKRAVKKSSKLFLKTYYVNSEWKMCWNFVAKKLYYTPTMSKIFTLSGGAHILYNRSLFGCRFPILS